MSARMSRRAGLDVPPTSRKDVIRYEEEVKCKLSCGELVEAYGTSKPTREELRVIGDQHDLDIMHAMDQRNLNEILKARRNRDCFEKWKNKCLPKAEVEQREIAGTRARIEHARVEAGMLPSGKRRR